LEGCAIGGLCYWSKSPAEVRPGVCPVEFTEMIDVKRAVTPGWRLAVYTLVVAAIVGGFVAQMLQGDCPV